MTRVGRHRWPVEEYHKEGKAEGLDQYQIRNFEAIEKHSLGCLGLFVIATRQI